MQEDVIGDGYLSILEVLIDVPMSELSLMIVEVVDLVILKENQGIQLTQILSVLRRVRVGHLSEGLNYGHIIILQ